MVVRRPGGPAVRGRRAVLAMGRKFLDTLGLWHQTGRWRKAEGFKGKNGENVPFLRATGTTGDGVCSLKLHERLKFRTAGTFF